MQDSNLTDIMLVEYIFEALMIILNSSRNVSSNNLTDICTFEWPSIAKNLKVLLV